MFRFQVNGSGSEAKRTVVLFLLLCAILSMAVAIAAPSEKRPGQATRAVASAANADPETLLINVYQALGDQNLRAALQKADHLVRAYPNFQLGHLVRGDLLLMHTRPIRTLGAVTGPEEQLKNLRDEAMLRLRALQERPSPSLVPRLVLQLRDDQKHVLLVDAKRSRLYVYANEAGQLRFVTDYYISQGKYGIYKLKEGDQRTPVGVYYITSHLPDARLPEFYGSGALPINYPNEWDKLHGRSGSGIWLHGTPPDSFSRPPLASDGCVVLTNPDFTALSRLVDIGKTPVIISERIEFVAKNHWESDRNLAAQMVEDWRRDVERMNADRMLAHYSSRFKSDRGEDLATWFSRQQQLVNPGKQKSMRLLDTTHFFYPGDSNLIVSTFTQQAGSGKTSTLTRTRQYWKKEGSRWKIIHELNL